MPIDNKMVSKEIRDVPKNEPLGEDWNPFPPLPQGPLGIPSPPPQDMAIILDKGLVTPTPPIVQLEVEK